MNASTEPLYAIPARFRRIENLHIIFWLAKDMAWCADWRIIGVSMAVPTILISIVVAYRTRHLAAELAHNLAVSFWISANALWMVSEFAGFDEKQVWGEVMGRHLALIPFGIGLLILLRYYLYTKPRESGEEQTATM